MSLSNDITALNFYFVLYLATCKRHLNIFVSRIGDQYLFVIDNQLFGAHIWYVCLLCKCSGIICTLTEMNDVRIRHICIY